MKGNTLREDGTCKVCGAKPYCEHAVHTSGMDDVSVFWLKCPGCGDIDIFSHVDMTGADVETCPWCGKTAYEPCSFYFEAKIGKEKSVKIIGTKAQTSTQAMERINSFFLKIGVLISDLKMLSAPIQGESDIYINPR